jgi:5-hydroxyisourate hydrolase
MSGSARSAITTHVLDLATGRPAKGIRVLLRKKEEDSRRWTVIGSGMTNADGRVEALLPADSAISAGTYQLRFDTLFYFKEDPSSLSSAFFPEVAITFSVTDPEAHYHVPLLLSPFGFSTYRGS